MVTFFGKLADTIILALSNSLGLPFIVFTSSIYQLVITITPRHLNVLIPVYLTFNPSGAGHYDGVVLFHDDGIQPVVLPLTSNGADAGKGPCSCGKNDEINRHITLSSCMLHQSIQQLLVLAARKASLVKTCADARLATVTTFLGKKLPTTDSIQTSRKRPRQSWQQKTSKSVMKFAVDAREYVSSGP